MLRTPTTINYNQYDTGLQHLRHFAAPFRSFMAPQNYRRLEILRLRMAEAKNGTCNQSQNRRWTVTTGVNFLAHARPCHAFYPAHQLLCQYNMHRSCTAFFPHLRGQTDKQFITMLVL